MTKMLKTPFTLDQSQLKKCLRNTTILLSGDSNARLMFNILARRVGCKGSLGTGARRWHHPLSCTDVHSNISISWHLHSRPLEANDRSLLTDAKPTTQLLNEIPAEGKFVVLIHLYLHFTPHHYSLLAKTYHVTRLAMERVLHRNPHVKFVIRGPHQVLHGAWLPVVGGDLAAPLFTKIIKREFQGLEDKIYFLQPWDMTVAVESCGYHPEGFVNEAITGLFVQYLCA